MTMLQITHMPQEHCTALNCTVSVLRSALVKIFGVSRMRNFFFVRFPSVDPSQTDALLQSTTVKFTNLLNANCLKQNMILGAICSIFGAPVGFSTGCWEGEDYSFSHFPCLLTNPSQHRAFLTPP